VESLAAKAQLLILHMPEAMEDPPPLNDGHFSYLMQFTDGNRIDLTLFPIAKLHQFGRECLSLPGLNRSEKVRLLFC
jgi:aminoglycoside 6-adenylyltransferase